MNFFKNVVESYGSHEEKGLRSTMDDVSGAIVPWNLPDGAYFGLFDGHGGSSFNTSSLAAHQLPIHLKRQVDLNNGFDVPAAFRRVYPEIDRSIEAQARAGTTAVNALILGTRMVIAHAGDSRALLERNGDTMFLTEDHVPSLPSESIRIAAASDFSVSGNRIYLKSDPRVWITVTRSLGDRDFSSVVSPEPDVSEHALTSSDTRLVLASDGVWYFLPEDDPLVLIRHIEDPQVAARELVKIALDNHSDDNLSVIVANLKVTS